MVIKLSYKNIPNDVEKAFDSINLFTSELKKIVNSEFEEYSMNRETMRYEIPDNYGEGFYITKFGIIKRYSKKLSTYQGIVNYTVIDKKITPLIIYPSQLIEVDGKEELELSNGVYQRIVTDETFANLRNLKMFLVSFHKFDSWFDGDKDDVVRYEKMISTMIKILKLKPIKMKTQLGWNGNLFCPYDIPVFSKNAELKRLAESLISTGNIEKWKEKINTKYRTSLLFEFQFLNALLAPMLYRYKWLGNWSHLYGKFSTGKTAGLIAICSIYGNPDENGKGFLNSFNTTIVGLETLMYLINNLPVFLNDSQNLNNKINVTDLIYMSMQGKGRLRGTKEADMREIKQWHTNILSNGERPLLKEGIYEGAAKRCVQIEGTMVEKEESKKSRSFFYENYGLIGETWINILKKQSKSKIESIRQKYYDLLKDSDKLDDNVITISQLCTVRYLYEVEINNTEQIKAFKETQDIGFKLLSLIDITAQEVDKCNVIIKYLRALFVEQKEKFDLSDNYAKEKIGYVDNNDNTIVFYSLPLKKIIEDEFEYSYKMFCKEIRDRELVEIGNDGKLKAFKLNGSTVRYPKFKMHIFVDKKNNNKDNDNTNLQKKEVDINKMNIQILKYVNINRNFDAIYQEKPFDLKNTTESEVLGSIFLDDKNNIYIPKFEQIKTETRCIENLQVTWGRNQLLLYKGENFEEQLNTYKQQRIKIE